MLTSASIWMYQVQKSFAIGHAQTGENPELRAIFHRLAILAEQPMHLIFVADGPSRPSVKRGRKVGTNPHWLTEVVRKFVSAFGFAWLEVRVVLRLA